MLSLTVSAWQQSIGIVFLATVTRWIQSFQEIKLSSFTSSKWFRKKNKNASYVFIDQNYLSQVELVRAQSCGTNCNV